MYYNYHGKATRLLKEGHLTEYRYVDEYNDISPCMLLIFDNNRPMPIRAHRFDYYIELIKTHYPNMKCTQINELNK